MKRVNGYVHRQDFIVRLCQGKRVLDLGIVGATCENSDLRVDVFPTQLHLRIAGVCGGLVGMDYSAKEIDAIRQRFPDLTLYSGDVTELSCVMPPAKFEVVVMGNLIEHLSNPGRALDEIATFLTPESRLIITCPNAFGLPNFLRFTAGRFEEGADHVASYTKHTLSNLLRRHQYEVLEVWSGVDATPTSTTRKALYALGSPVLRRAPEIGGTLIVVAQPRREATASLALDGA